MDNEEHLTPGLSQVRGEARGETRGEGVIHLTKDLAIKDSEIVNVEHQRFNYLVQQ